MIEKIFVSRAVKWQPYFHLRLRHFLSNVSFLPTGTEVFAWPTPWIVCVFRLSPRVSSLSPSHIHPVFLPLSLSCFCTLSFSLHCAPLTPLTAEAALQQACFSELPLSRPLSLNSCLCRAVYLECWTPQCWAGHCFLCCRGKCTNTDRLFKPVYFCPLRIKLLEHTCSWLTSQDKRQRVF